MWGWVVADVLANVLLTRLKQHDHPLSFLSVPIYSRAPHLKEPSRRLYLKDYEARTEQVVESFSPSN